MLLRVSSVTVRVHSVSDAGKFGQFNVFKKYKYIISRSVPVYQGYDIVIYIYMRYDAQKSNKLRF